MKVESDAIREVLNNWPEQFSSAPFMTHLENDYALEYESIGVHGEYGGIAVLLMKRLVHDKSVFYYYCDTPVAFSQETLDNLPESILYTSIASFVENAIRRYERDMEMMITALRFDEELPSEQGTSHMRILGDDNVLVCDMNAHPNSRLRHASVYVISKDESINCVTHFIDTSRVHAVKRFLLGENSAYDRLNLSLMIDRKLSDALINLPEVL